MKRLLRLRTASQRGADFEVLQHRAFRKNAAALRTKHYPLFYPQAWLEGGDVLAPVADLTQHGNFFPASSLFLDFPIQNNARDGVHQRGFAGAIRAQNPYDLRLAHTQSYIVDGEPVLVKDHQIFDRKHKHSIGVLDCRSNGALSETHCSNPPSLHYSILH